MRDPAFREAFGELIKEALPDFRVFYGAATRTPSLPAAFVHLVSIDTESEALSAYREAYNYRLTFMAKAEEGGPPSELQALTLIAPFLEAARDVVKGGFAGHARLVRGPFINFEASVSAEEPLAVVNVEYSFDVSRIQGDS